MVSMPTKVSIPTRSSNITLVLLDVRGSITKTVLRGSLQFPLPLFKDGEKVRYPIPEFKSKPIGVVCDASFPNLTIVFPFIDPTDGQHVKGHFLSTDDITNLFLQFEPRLKKAIK